MNRAKTRSPELQTFEGGSRPTSVRRPSGTRTQAPPWGVPSELGPTLVVVSPGTEAGQPRRPRSSARPTPSTDDSAACSQSRLEAAMKAHPKVKRTERDQDGYSIGD